MEALRLLSGSALTAPPPLAVEHELLAVMPVVPEAPTSPPHAWDAALGQSRVGDLLAPTQTEADPAAIRSGMEQLDRYLARTWYRAGIPADKHDDCTQAVYVALLQNLGRDGFDHLAGDIGQYGIREVLSRETPEGPDFFRAVDMVKKRAVREKSYQALDEADVPGPSGAESDEWRGALHEAIDRTLNPREAALVYATLRGENPADIAKQWGVAPKTVSNEKTRVIAKLRDALAPDLSD
ncbi:MAG: sigma-70 family RNA polymerase sigma factor [Isosphaeraceae bacterium]|nr:sigma-70 family RNA polymerase sigma factor [Isosphaeraceae bacterium]